MAKQMVSLACILATSTMQTLLRFESRISNQVLGRMAAPEHPHGRTLGLYAAHHLTAQFPGVC